MSETWRVLNEEVLFEAPRLKLTRETVETSEGQIVEDYYQIHMGQAAVIAAQDAHGRFIMLDLYKHGPRKSGLGFPGGGVETGEDPLDAAKRELLEETGYAAPDWRNLGGYTVHSNQGAGFVTFFAARGARKVAEPIGGDLEPHVFKLLSREEIKHALETGALLSMGHVCMAALTLSLT